jgi:signal transduction histidine kinase
MFIASMSHELRTPLNSIIGFTGIMLQEMYGEINEEQRKQLNLVKNSANHLLALINDVIDISKIMAGKVEIAMEEFDLSVLIQEIKDSFAVAIDKKRLELLPQTPQTFLIKSDKRRTKQILVNFISNAIKFTDRGEIEIKVIQKNEIVEVSVRDTGIGIKKEDMGKLFETFSRITTKDRIEEGTGLGLYLSQKIAHLLGGDITAKSEFGKGSVFTLTLPLKR